MSKNENRLNFRMTDETAAKIERWYQEDNCRSKNEFIEKAVNCYADMLAAGESATLPRAVQSAIDARLKLFEDRIASLLVERYAAPPKEITLATDDDGGITLKTQ